MTYSPSAGGEMRNDDEITAKFDRSELVRGYPAIEAGPPTCSVTVRVGVKTDLGCVRENNEDKAEYYEPERPDLLAGRGCVYIVADGMGGHAAGQIASEMAIKTFMASYYGSGEADIETALKAAAAEANAQVFGASTAVQARAGMGTTLTALTLVDGRAYVTQIGDSRAYLMRNGTIRQVTEDHSWVGEQIRLGQMTEAEAECSPYRNIITRCIGNQPAVEADVYATDIRRDDRWVLCSDGLTGHVQADEIRAIASSECPSEACRQLVQLACSRGGRDNVTVLIAQLLDVERTAAPMEAPAEAADAAPAEVASRAAKPPQAWKGLLGLRLWETISGTLRMRTTRRGGAK